MHAASTNFRRARAYAVGAAGIAVLGSVVNGALYIRGQSREHVVRMRATSILVAGRRDWPWSDRDVTVAGVGIGGTLALESGCVVLAGSRPPAHGLMWPARTRLIDEGGTVLIRLRTGQTMRVGDQVSGGAVSVAKKRSAASGCGGDRAYFTVLDLAPIGQAGRSDR